MHYPKCISYVLGYKIDVFSTSDLTLWVTLIHKTLPTRYIFTFMNNAVHGIPQVTGTL